VPGVSTSSCWYPPTQNGIKDLIAASNSLWIERRRWCSRSVGWCQGWTECTATINIMDKQTADAIVLRKPSNQKAAIWSVQGTQHFLKAMYQRGCGSLPVIFFTETKGMDQDECIRHWGGSDCDDGYRKEFISLLFNFSDGACLSFLPGCKDVCYFPAINGSCSPTMHSSSFCQAQERERDMLSAAEIHKVHGVFYISFSGPLAHLLNGFFFLQAALIFVLLLSSWRKPRKHLGGITALIIICCYVAARLTRWYDVHVQSVA